MHAAAAIRKHGADQHEAPIVSAAWLDLPPSDWLVPLSFLL
jgi:hypothetical protein